jgi:hypothetical protein
MVRRANMSMKVKLSYFATRPVRQQLALLEGSA